MLAVVLFLIILVIAAAAMALYYRSEAFPPAPGRRTLFSRPKSREGIESDETGGETRPDDETPDTALKSLFLPGEEGIFHQASRITEHGWSDLDYTLSSLSRLPSESLEILDLLASPDASESDVSAVSGRNAELVDRILKVVNSPFCGLDTHIDDLKAALAALGLQELRQIVMVSSLFHNAMDVPEPIDPEGLWRHSLSTAGITSWLADMTPVPVRRNLAGTCAMFHDVGKLVLQNWRPEGFKRAVALSRARNVGLMVAELRELGLTHPLAGLLLMHRWRLPVSASWVVRGCHLPVINSDMPEAALVFLAGQVARYMALGSDGEPGEDRIQDDVRELLGITAESVTDLVSASFEGFVKSTLADRLLPGVAL
jgi:HD-like signal output (HDOD) protein